MQKIQSDTVNGIYVVDDYDTDAVVYDSFEDFYADLPTMGDGHYGCEATDEQIDSLDAEYGVKK